MELPITGPEFQRDLSQDFSQTDGSQALQNSLYVYFASKCYLYSTDCVMFSI